MNMREIMALVEGFMDGDGPNSDHPFEPNDKDESVDSDYYMTEGCDLHR